VGTVLALMLWQNVSAEIRTQLTEASTAPPTDNITAIVAIDDLSLAAYGRTPANGARHVRAPTWSNS